MESKKALLEGLEIWRLPANAQELVNLVGLAETMALVERFGGLTMRIPLGETPRGRAMLDDVADCAGDDAACAIARRYGGTEFYIPNCKNALVKARDRFMLMERRRMAGEGLSEREIVRRLSLRHRLSDRYVWRLLKKPLPEAPRPPTGQGILPGC